MKQNTILSLAAAMVLTSTSAMAFEADINDDIFTLNSSDVKTYSTYTVGASSSVAPANLNLSANQFGDALVYPAYSTKDGWNTEITVRNTSAQAVVAKVVLYAKSDSRELRDFNIYLSTKDVFTFSIANNEIRTSDGSLPKSVAYPDNAKPTTSTTAVTMVDHGNDDYKITNLDAAEGEDEGYVIIYGMAESTDNGYHTAGSTVGHENLFRDYRKNLDACRVNWASAYENSGMVNGMMVTDQNVTVPAVLDTCNNAIVVATGDLGQTSSTGTTTVLTAAQAALNPADTAARNFGSVDSNSLSGTVKLSLANGTDSRDMILPATALSNFSDTDTMVLWTEGEYAAIADRRIVTGSTVGGTVHYDSTNIAVDANAFVQSSSMYTYKEGSLKNKLMYTQPMKRILVQTLGNSSFYKGTEAKDRNMTTNYGYFTTETALYNENEATTTVGGVVGPIISPFNSSTASIEKFIDEVATLEDIEKSVGEESDNPEDFQASGWASVVTGTPAIVTQMVGSVAVDGDAQVNWIYAPTQK